jgi:hypothetical protein
MLLEVWGFCWLYYGWKNYLTDIGTGERGKCVLWLSICNLKMYFQQKRQQYWYAYYHSIRMWLCRRVVHFSKRIYHKIQNGTFWEGKWVAYKTFAHCTHVRYYCGMKFHGTGKGKVFPSHAWNNMEEWTCNFTHFQLRRLRTPAALSPWNELRVPIVRKTGCPQGWSGPFGVEINPLFVMGLKPRLLLRIPRSLVTVPTTLFRLRKNAHYIARDVDKVFENTGFYVCCSEWFDTKKNYSGIIDVLLLGAFTKLRKATLSFVMSLRLSMPPRGTTRLLLDGFSWNLIIFLSAGEIKVSLKSHKSNG